ncbi:hypothetical protein EYF80_055347 [Liparis tanakae]|uniref:Uncharacterized protein n=1 Tax=Liparis tanakae TaxID=230148 RepID=A0A4Z2F149_9TELE|nr:hypothetical protein EYF80_055347 [Liparis tanakae]
MSVVFLIDSPLGVIASSRLEPRRDVPLHPRQRRLIPPVHRLSCSHHKCFVSFSRPHLACASSKLWSVMVMICCNMSPMSCLRPSPSAPAVPSCMCCARPGCPAMPTPWECINRGCSSIIEHTVLRCLASSNFFVIFVLISRRGDGGGEEEEEEEEKGEEEKGEEEGEEGEEEEKYPRKFLCVSVSPDTPPFFLAGLGEI